MAPIELWSIRFANVARPALRKPVAAWAREPAESRTGPSSTQGLTASPPALSPSVQEEQRHDRRDQPEKPRVERTHHSNRRRGARAEEVSHRHEEQAAKARPGSVVAKESNAAHLGGAGERGDQVL